MALNWPPFYYRSWIKIIYWWMGYFFQKNVIYEHLRETIKSTFEFVLKVNLVQIRGVRHVLALAKYWLLYLFLETSGIDSTLFPQLRKILGLLATLQKVFQCIFKKFEVIKYVNNSQNKQINWLINIIFGLSKAVGVWISTTFKLKIEWSVNGNLIQKWEKLNCMWC